MSWRQLLSSVRSAVTWWVIIAPWERALRVRLGKVVKTLEPGVHSRIPGIDRIFIQPIRIRTSDIGVQTVTTKDGKAVTVAGVVKYRVSDLEKLYNSLHDGAATITDMAASEIARFITNREFDNINPTDVEQYVARELDLGSYGLGESSVNITDFAAVRTYRLMTDDRRYRDGGWLDMSEKHEER